MALLQVFVPHFVLQMQFSCSVGCEARGAHSHYNNLNGKNPFRSIRLNTPQDKNTNIVDFPLKSLQNYLKEVRGNLGCLIFDMSRLVQIVFLS